MSHTIAEQQNIDCNNWTLEAIQYAWSKKNALNWNNIANHITTYITILLSHTILITTLITTIIIMIVIMITITIIMIVIITMIIIMIMITILIMIKIIIRKIANPKNRNINCNNWNEAKRNNKGQKRAPKARLQPPPHKVNRVGSL